MKLDNARIFWALLRRDLKVLRPQLPSRFIDSTVLIAVQVLLWGSLFPTMGMPTALIAPVFIGSQLITFLVLNDALAVKLVYDIQFGRFIDYHLTLPLPKRWLFAQYVTYFVMKSVIITGPSITFGIILLGNAFPLDHSNLPAFIFVYLLGLIFFATLFVSSAFVYEPMWFRKNFWARRSTPLLATSCTIFTWKTAYAFSPKVSMLLLASPGTHIIEAMRNTLLKSEDYLPLMLSVPVLIGFIGLNVWQLIRGVHKRLDPV